MIKTNAALLVCAMIVCAPAAFAQANGANEDTGRGEGLGVTLVLEADAFRLTNRQFSHTEIRPLSMQNTTSTEFAVNNMDFWADSLVQVRYDGRYFGGHFKLKKAAIENTGFGYVSGRVSLGMFRFTLGNDIESVYADALGADPGLRLYTGSERLASRQVVFHSENADNITQDDGLLLEAFLGPWNIALAAGDFFSTPVLALNVPNTNIYGERKEQSFRYGMRVGYELENVGRFNVSYILKEQTTATKYGYRGANSTEIVALDSTAQIYEHLFGLYGSVRLPRNVELTVGYTGHLTKYLDEFFTSAQGMVQTGLPTLFINGLNVNARYRADRYTLRTDNTVSFWTSKNYAIFETNDQRLNADIGTQAAGQADRFAAIDHFIMWNGVGFAYALSEKAEASVYGRNLFARYSASGMTPAGRGDYTLTRDQISLELKFLYRVNARAEAFVSVDVQNQITIRSRDLNAQSRSEFIEFVNNNVSQGIRPTPVETRDNELTVKVPIGINIKFR